VVPTQYDNFLIASTGASAALLGLLFVSVSIAPERVFGPSAKAGHRGLALSSFTALANAFFISLSGLVPNLPFGLFVIIVGGIAFSQSLSLLPTAREWKSEGRLIRGIILLTAGIAVYGSEIFLGIDLYLNKASAELISVLLQLLLAVFAMGLARAWELLGAPRARGVVSSSFEWVEGRLEKKPPEPGRE
jgi:hypothetical protein